MTTAFVLSGGCSLGAVQVGMLQALEARGVRPDLLVGTSAGAFNAAYVSGHGLTAGSLARLEAVWAGLVRRDIFPLEATRVLRSLGGGSNALCSDRGLRSLVTRHLPFSRLEEAPIPLHVVATDFLSGQEVLLSSGPAVDAIVASGAIPGLLPSVPYGGSHLVDGGLADNVAISQAVALGARTVYVLPTGYSCALTRPPRTPLGAAAHAFSVLVQQRLVAELERYSDTARLVVLPPPCPIGIPAVDFGHARELVADGRATAAAALDHDAGRGSPATAVALHRHEPLDRPA